MQEKVLSNKKNGMLVLLLLIIAYIAAIAGVIFGGMMMDEGGNPVLFIVSMLVIKALMDYVRKRNFAAFGYYRIILGAIILLYFVLK